MSLITAELGPGLCLSVASVSGGLDFQWTDLSTNQAYVGTNWVYTLEGKESVASTNWFPLPGAAWPLKTNHWVLPLADAGARFYRVTAKESKW